MYILRNSHTTSSPFSYIVYWDLSASKSMIHLIISSKWFRLLALILIFSPKKKKRFLICQWANDVHENGQINPIERNAGVIHHISFSSKLIVMHENIIFRHILRRLFKFFFTNNSIFKYQFWRKPRVHCAYI